MHGPRRAINIYLIHSQLHLPQGREKPGTKRESFILGTEVRESISTYDAAAFEYSVFICSVLIFLFEVPGRKRFDSVKSCKWAKEMT